MKTGKYNIGAGLILIAVFMVYGFLLIYLRDLAPGKEEWISSYSSGKHFEARLAHTHGNLFAMLNIILGLLLPRLSLTDGKRKAVAVLGLFGMLMPIGILTEVYLDAPPMLVLLGGASMLVAVVWAGIAVARTGLQMRDL